MKLGIHAGLWMARWTDEIAPILRQVAELGFDGIEISLLGMTDDRAAAIGALVTDHGLEITCSDGLPSHADISAANPEIRAAGCAHLANSIALSARMGANCLAGVLYGPWGHFEPARIEDRTQYAAASLSSLKDILERNDIVLGLEAINRFETDLVNTAQQAVRLAQLADVDRVGLLLDTFHLNIEEKDIGAAIAVAGDRLVHFHVSDNDRGVPGSGHIPWPAVRAALSAIGYDGWIVAEMFVTAGTPAAADLNIWRTIESDATTAARQALAFMRETFP